MEPRGFIFTKKRRSFNHVFIYNPNDLTTILSDPGEPCIVLMVDGHAVQVEALDGSQRRILSFTLLKKNPPKKETI